MFLTSNCTKKANLKPNNVEVIAIETAAKSMEDYHNFWIGMAKCYRFDEEVVLEDFADKFVLTPGRIKDIFEEAQKLSQWHGKDWIDRKLLQKVCFEKIEHNLGKKAQKVNMVYQWEDLILPDYQKNMLKAACDQIKYKYKVFTEWGFGEKIAYGTGLSMILSGSPGTGKTMAAQIIAKELGLELYRIELASVVSKYIGETERNLNEIFEEAKKSQAVIFFDEADVLFSKRSEVKDSNDKYSNMEAAFLLQKIEEYTGIVILATNYQQNIDEAFKRRIKFLIDFPFPDKAYRKKIWLRVFPDRLPVSTEIDYDFLAEHFELSGSNIKNVALNAAFLAASVDNSVGMEHIMKAVVNEFTKSGKKLSKEDLGEYYMYV
jgi:SpoVK/Ycf46/Vps4 family AAA+-type ATPase